MHNAIDTVSRLRTHTASADAAASRLLRWTLGRDHPSSVRKSLEEVEQWCATGSTAKVQSDLGPQLDDLELVDPNGMVRRDGAHMVLAGGRQRGRHLEEFTALAPRDLQGLLSPNGIEDADAVNDIKAYLNQE